VRDKLGAAVDAGIDPHISDADLRQHPLAIWVETRLGIERENTHSKWVRAKPRSVAVAACRLAEEAGQPVEAAVRALQAFLLIAAVPESARRTDHQGERERPFFPFRLHQFISGAGNALTTLDAPSSRSVEMEGQRVGRKRERVGDGSGRHAPRSGLHQQPEYFEAIFLCERGESRDSIFLFHISTNIEMI